MSLMTLTGCNGKKVDIDPEQVVAIKDDPDSFCCITFKSGSWVALDLTREEVRKAIDIELETRRTFANIESSKQRLVEVANELHQANTSEE